ncbi:MAG: hypothetical protein GC200_06535 [Tepidisphaera sp.]|nr:hypothetical protein [Tepidisphaera sp.]
MSSQTLPPPSLSGLRGTASPPKAAITPLWAAFLFTFLNSVGCMTVTSNALFFITKQGYHFSENQNSFLGVLLGVTYIVGALCASRVPRLLKRLFPRLTQRGVLATFMVCLAALACVPVLGGFLDSDPARPSTWPIWTIVLCYTPITGMLWPIVESYISGGRKAGPLRSTIGRWNIVWSSSGVFASLLVAPLVEKNASLVLACVGVGHLLAAGVLTRFTPFPAPHVHEEHAATPPVYAKLLVTFRMLLPMSYVVCSALGPYLPSAAVQLHVAESAQAMIAIAWLLPRVCGFILMQRWQGWHGRWFVPILGGLVLIGGFSIAITATSLPGWLGVGDSIGLFALIAGLALFGLGMSIIYAGAIYYAMEVGQAEVDAGGTHEALIGVGYMAGPAFLLFAGLAVSNHLLAPESYNPVVLASVLVVALATAIAVVLRVAAHSKPDQA